MIVLDTHALIWLITANANLGPRSQRMIRSAIADSAVFVSAITFWEIALLTAKQRLRPSRSPADQRLTVLDSGIQELPVTGEIAINAVELNNLPGDPADRLIVATAIWHGATLMTADEALLNWRHTLRRTDASK